MSSPSYFGRDIRGRYWSSDDYDACVEHSDSYEWFRAGLYLDFNSAEVSVTHVEYGWDDDSTPYDAINYARRGGAYSIRCVKE